MSKLSGVMKQFVKVRTQLQNLLSENKTEIANMDSRTKVLTSENTQIEQILETPFMKSVNLEK